MQTSKKKRPETPKQGATDLRSNAVKWMRGRLKEITEGIDVKMRIPGLVAAHQVLKLQGALESMEEAIGYMSTTDERARARKGGW